MQFLAFHYLHRSSNTFCTSEHNPIGSAPGSAGPAPGSPMPQPGGNIGGGHINRMGQPRVHSDVALDPGPYPGVDDAEAGLPRTSGRDFLIPAPEWTLSPGRDAHSIGGNTFSRYASRESPQGASALTSALRRAPRRKRYRSTVRGLVRSKREESGQMLPLMSLRHDRPALVIPQPNIFQRSSTGS